MPMPRKPGFFYRMFHDLYEVQIIQEENTRVFYMKELSKLTPNYFKGVDENGIKIEYKSSEPFDFFKKKLY